MFITQKDHKTGGQVDPSSIGMPGTHNGAKSWPNVEFLEELLTAHPPPGWQMKPSKQHQSAQQVA